MDYPDYENDIFCTACGSTDIEEIPEDEKNYGIGLYQIYDGFLGGLFNDFQYECQICLHRF